MPTMIHLSRILNKLNIFIARITSNKVTYLKPFSVTMYCTSPSTSGSDHFIFHIRQKQYINENRERYKIWLEISYYTA